MRVELILQLHFKTVIRIGGTTGSGGEVMISSASTAIPPEGLISAHDLG